MRVAVRNEFSVLVSQDTIVLLCGGVLTSEMVESAAEVLVLRADFLHSNELSESAVAFASWSVDVTVDSARRLTRPVLPSSHPAPP